MRALDARRYLSHRPCLYGRLYQTVRTPTSFDQDLSYSSTQTDLTADIHLSWGHAKLLA
jgi:hypothetical protein